MLLKCFGFYRSKSHRQYLTVIQELCHQFSLEDLSRSTNNFDHTRTIGIGCRVYKGCLEHNGVTDYVVALKRICGSSHHAILEFKNEIELLCQLRHPNLVSLIGFCDEQNEKFLVYEYTSNGSLDQHLQRGELSWKKRLEICIGAARGLHYLHAGAKRTIIHRVIKPSNILLDDNMEPKLTGFGLSVQGQSFMSKPKPIKVDNIAGTFGYIPLEYMMGSTITDKTDVYSFGVVLLEVVCGGKYVRMVAEREFLEKPVEEIIDPNIKGKIAQECWQVFLSITERCVKHEVDERPTMGEVEVELEHALSLQEQADLTNTNGNCTLLSKTIINQNSEPEIEDALSLHQKEDITEDSDLDMFPYLFGELKSIEGAKTQEITLKGAQADNTSKLDLTSKCTSHFD